MGKGTSWEAKGELWKEEGAARECSQYPGKNMTLPCKRKQVFIKEWAELAAAERDHHLLPSSGDNFFRFGLLACCVSQEKIMLVPFRRKGVDHSYQVAK